ncbi:Uncharacterised protein [Mycobacteroides abscessus]|nr:Uncharacterised protein [Mycobacteroides abscessus]
MVNESQRSCHAPPGPRPPSSTSGSSPARRRWYADDSPAWPAPTTTTSCTAPPGPSRSPPAVPGAAVSPPWVRSLTPTTTTRPDRTFPRSR